ncbi:MAG: VOC family protein [Proteobacteria bacterium]|nr:VOC family protein [Pseudomonadota bacterium]
MGVRDPDAEARFFREALELEESEEGRFRCGDSIVFIEGDPDAVSDDAFEGGGYRYFTTHVFDCRQEHARILEAGVVEGFAPRQTGNVAVISMVRDPDGNWIEISQRGTLTGSLSTS